MAHRDIDGLELTESAAERLALGRALPEAMIDGEVRVHLQPIVVLSERRVIGFEAFPRWQHPDRGLIGADVLVPVAVESGLHEELDRCVIEHSLSLLERATGQWSIAVHVADSTIRDRGFARWLTSLVRPRLVDPSRLTLERDLTVEAPTHGEVRDALAPVGVGLRARVPATLAPAAAAEELETGTTARLPVSSLHDWPPSSGGLGQVVIDGIDADEQVAEAMEWGLAHPVESLCAQGPLFGAAADGEARLAGFLELSSSSPAGLG